MAQPTSLRLQHPKTSLKDRGTSCSIHHRSHSVPPHPGGTPARWSSSRRSASRWQVSLSDTILQNFEINNCSIRKNVSKSSLKDKDGVDPTNPVRGGNDHEKQLLRCCSLNGLEALSKSFPISSVFLRSRSKALAPLSPSKRLVR